MCMHYIQGHERAKCVGVCVCACIYVRMSVCKNIGVCLEICVFVCLCVGVGMCVLDRTLTLISHTSAVILVIALLALWNIIRQ